ncbi:hypothetical protein [Rummeliibacillus stabekisii]|uniref:hypothetical protein n=1 Tax=Rummeliibacillus stabekisii TaxID=241244 RepID=UPI003723925E
MEIFILLIALVIIITIFDLLTNGSDAKYKRGYQSTNQTVPDKSKAKPPIRKK